MKVKRRSLTGLSYSVAVGVAFLLGSAAGCRRGEDEPVAPQTIQVGSKGIVGGTISRAYTCDGQGISPELFWSAPPAKTRSLALTVTDLDSPLGFNFVHWVVYNIAPGAGELPAALPILSKFPNGMQQGLNGQEKAGYTPPCPHGNAVHRYRFALYAVDRDVDLSSASRKQLLAAIRGHVIAKGEMIGRYGR